jgi:AAA domain
MSSNNKPITQQRDLAKLPRALAPLIERPQWAVWKWTQKPDGSWQKPPFMATQPDRHASTTDPGTWSSYQTALAAVQARHADGISYILTPDDPFGAIDLDYCRDLETHSIDIWAQLFLHRGRDTYTEVTPSGTGVRIWGLTDGGPLHKKFTLKAGDREFEPDKIICAELFRRTHKALTITGYRLDTIRELTNIDRVFDWAIIWAERRKAEAAAAEEVVRAANGGGNGFDSSGCGYGIDQIEQFVREGAPPEENRSELFHTIVGHYLGCGWSREQIWELLHQYPDGIGGRYLGEGRLTREIDRSADKFGDTQLPLFDNGGWVNGGPAKAAPSPQPQPQPSTPPPPPPPSGPPPWEDDPELEDEVTDDGGQSDCHDDELEDDDDLDEDEEQSEEPLPPLYTHGSPDRRPIATWLIKHIIPAKGHGLLSGQWGTAKTFVAIDLAAAVATGQLFLQCAIKRQCGVLFIAAEGANQVRLRFDAVWKEKCGDGKERAPFCWYETAPLLLHKGSVEKLVAMARQAEAMLMQDHGLPLGLIIVDTLVACAGYRRSGEENDNAVGQALMNVLKAVAEEIGCFVLGVDHFGKDMEAGTRGAASKEGSADSVLVCLGHRELSGAVANARLAVRKNRGGPQGREYPFALRLVDMGMDEDGEPETTMVVDWLPAGAVAGAQARPEPDPWLEGCRRDDQRAVMLRFKRVLHEALAEQGVERPIPSALGVRTSGAPIGEEVRTGSADAPTVRMVNQETVREAFYLCTPGDPRQTQHSRFQRARDRAELLGLVSAGNVGDITYLWLTRPAPEDMDNACEDDV